MNERKNWDSHIWLYAKYHYKRGNVIEDLNKILADRSGIKAEHIDIKSIFIVLCEIVYPYLSEYNFVTFLEDSFRKWVDYETTTTLEKVFERLLWILHDVKVKEYVNDKWVILIELDEPDYNILPKYKDIY